MLKYFSSFYYQYKLSLKIKLNCNEKFFQYDGHIVISLKLMTEI